MNIERRAGLERRTHRVLGSQIDSLSMDDTLNKILEWGHARESKYIAISNVHVVVTARREADFQRVINGANMATPDGAPIAWMLRRSGCIGQQRVSGPDLMWALCERCEAEKLPVYFYGSTEDTLSLMADRLLAAFPRLLIAGLDSPPFRLLSDEENALTVARINSSAAGVVFVGLGCPKQEQWMADRRGYVNAVMIGVGAAFDFHAGTLARAPEWMQNNGLEWLHRLYSEPRRLWKRYLVTNTLFLFHAARQLISGNAR